jgi:hypothetical protein
VLRAVQQNDNRHPIFAHGHDWAPGKHDAVAYERRIRHVECDPMTGRIVKMKPSCRPRDRSSHPHQNTRAESL